MVVKIIAVHNGTEPVHHWRSGGGKIGQFLHFFTLQIAIGVIGFGTKAEIFDMCNLIEYIYIYIYIVLGNGGTFEFEIGSFSSKTNNIPVSIGHTILVAIAIIYND